MKIWITILVAVLFNNKLRICGSKEIIVPPDPDSPDFFNCINHNMECPSWASEGGCTKDGLKEYVDVSLLIVFIENIMIDLMKFIFLSLHRWMQLNCPIACNSCDMANPATRCTRQKLNMSETPIFGLGEMNGMLSSIEARYKDTHTVSVLSRTPWVITIDNFLTDEEISSIQLHATQWDQLSGLEHVDEDGRIEPAGRTSSKAWCNTDCLQVSLFY